MLTQIRTGKIGLRSFLHYRHVPTAPTPICSCGDGHETPRHIVLYCRLEAEGRERLRRWLGPRVLRTSRDFKELVGDRRTAGYIVRWLLGTGRLPQYGLAEALREEAAEEATEELLRSRGG